MEAVKAKQTDRGTSDRLGDYVSQTVLYEGEHALFKSQHGWQWAQRSLRAQLVEADALAIHRGRLLVHPERVAQVVERVAVERARARLNGHS